MPFKYLSYLGRRFPANVITATFNFRERRAFQLRQCFAYFVLPNSAVISHGETKANLIPSPSAVFFEKRLMKFVLDIYFPINIKLFASLIRNVDEKFVSRMNN